MDKPESFYAQLRMFARKKEDKKFQQIVFVNYKLEELVYLLDVMNFVNGKVIANKTILMSYTIYLHLFTLYHFFFLFESG